MYPEEEMHVAHPRLYGAPAYARPPLSASPTLPPDPDDLPLAADRTAEEDAIAEHLLAMPFGIAQAEPAPEPQAERRSKPILSVLTGRILRRAS